MEVMSEESRNAENIETTIVDNKKSDLNPEKQDSLGKFNDVKSLLNAYNSLEAEFTRRSQRLRELEGNCDNGKIKNFAPQNGEINSQNCTIKENPEILESANNLANQILEETELIQNKVLESKFLDKEKIIEEYLLGLVKNKQNFNLIGEKGCNVINVTKKPTNLSDANKLAMEYFKK